MLVLARKEFERSIITVPPSDRPTTIVVANCGQRGEKTRFGFEAPESVAIHREEVFRRREAERQREPAA